MKYRRIVYLFFTLYCLLMLWLMLHRPEAASPLPYWQQVQYRLNLIPFRTLLLFSRLLRDHRPYLVRTAVINLLGNVVMFIPLGIFLPLIFQKLRHLWKTLLVAALVISCVEMLQLFFLVGSCDVDDLILNLLGVGIGYEIYTRTAKPDC